MQINSRGSFAIISAQALQHNLDWIKTRVNSKTFICPMVKANAYGCGAIGVSQWLEKLKAEACGVISVEEAIEIREGGIKTPILVFDQFDPHFASQFLEYRLTPVISHWDQIRILKKVKWESKPNVHLKFNSGMNRLGFNLSEVNDVFDDVTSWANIEGVATHFLNGEDASSSEGESFRQMKNFEAVIPAAQKIKAHVHFLNSAALVVGANLSEGWKGMSIGARPGISLYGVNPVRTKEADLKPVMSIHARIEVLREVSKGEAVSYGPTWRANKSSHIAIVSIGYADGYSRNLGNKAHMICKGQRVPVIGTVCMDYCMIDLTNHSKLNQIKVGDSVTVVGSEAQESVSWDELAQHCGTISYELMTKVGKRLTHIFED